MAARWDKKSCRNVWMVRGNAVPLHSLFGETAYLPVPVAAGIKKFAGNFAEWKTCITFAKFSAEKRGASRKAIVH